MSFPPRTFKLTRISAQSFQDMVLGATFLTLTSQTAPLCALQFVNILLLVLLEYSSLSVFELLFCFLDWNRIELLGFSLYFSMKTKVSMI